MSIVSLLRRCPALWDTIYCVKKYDIGCSVIHVDFKIDFFFGFEIHHNSSISELVVASFLTQSSPSG